MIETVELTKTYGKVRAVDALSFTAPPGRVTGFLGLNGSGKTTTLRMLLGLTRPTSGVAFIDGKPFAELPDPVRRVGAVLDQGISHPGQTGRAYLRAQAILAGAARSRADALLEQVGLGDAAAQRTGDYSLGMRQRLAVASALLCEPPVLVLDEPANGLDPEGMAWLRGLLREHADAGGTVLLSSHLLAELAQLIDDVVIIANGQLRRAAPLTELYAATVRRLYVQGSDPVRLREAYERAGGQVSIVDDETLVVGGLDPRVAGDVAFEAGVRLYQLAVDQPNLEDIFLQLAGAR
jgi:ABC-2 type transport system ATP-binding protein